MSYAGKTRGNSDPLTGEWHGGIERLKRLGLPYIVIEDFNSARPKGQRKPIPARLHSATVEGRLGGHAFSAAFQKYCEPPKPANAPLPYEEKHWWANDWAEREMRALFPRDGDMVDIILWVRRDGRAWPDALEGSNRTIGEVKVVMRHMAKHCQAIMRMNAQRVQRKEERAA